MNREPVVSGQFYPSQEARLKKIIEDFKTKETARISAQGIILPHAGYVYSGKVAVTTVGKILPKKRLIILGTNHNGMGADFALWGKGRWRMPLGEVAIDEALAEAILTEAPLIKEDYSAHTYEHSIEVELPILYYFFGPFSFVPIACQISNLRTYREVAATIVKAIRTIKEEILLVASTDMTHYEHESSARKKDRDALESIINLDEEELVQKIRRNNISMCGIAPVAVFIAVLKALGAKKAQVALYQTSGEVSGDYHSVVGYAGVIVQ